MLERPVNGWNLPEFLLFWPLVLNMNGFNDYDEFGTDCFALFVYQFTLLWTVIGVCIYCFAL